MVFSSIYFLFIFFPIVLICHQLLPKKFKNLVLLLASIYFYAWGEPIYIVLMLYSAVFNYFMGLDIDRRQNPARRKSALIFTVIINLAMLGFFKYFGFVLGTLNGILPFDIPYHELALPIGISFYTFQALSYIFDVYKKKVAAQPSFLKFAVYLALFPQLVAGPIVKYTDIDKELVNRKVTIDKIGEGLVRFVFGLSKKVLLANNLGMLFSAIEAQTSRSVLTVWLGILAYAMQMYFDFSGYSDMAIGMGKMFGFTFPENFNYPYLSKSITEFWRRWHMTLSSWFRDYVYIPLGGNRSHHLRNILIVWALTGLWHGASWNFVLWGLYFGVLLLLEKFVLKDILTELPSVVQRIYTMLMLSFSWILFSNTDFGALKFYFGQVFGIHATGIIDSASLYYLGSNFILFVIGAACCTPMPINLFHRFAKKHAAAPAVICVILFLICTAYLVYSSYNPFLYFRF